MQHGKRAAVAVWNPTGGGGDAASSSPPTEAVTCSGTQLHHWQLDGPGFASPTASIGTAAAAGGSGGESASSIWTAAWDPHHAKQVGPENLLTLQPPPPPPCVSRFIAACYRRWC